MNTPIAIIIGFVLLGVVGRAAFNIYKEERLSREELALAEASMHDVATRKEFLSTEIERLESERGLEEEIRERFRVAKEGEQMFIIVEPDPSEGAVVNEQGIGVWGRIKNIFGF